MPALKIGDRVVIRLGGGAILRGSIEGERTLHTYTAPYVVRQWGISLDTAPFDIRYYDEEYVSKDPNYHSKSYGCQCGSTKLGHDRHSHWCPMYRKP